MIIPALAAVLAASAFAAEAPAAPRARADVHFLAGYDHYRSGRADDARREWKTCREIDETHDFCEFGLSVLDAGSPKGEAAPEREEPPVTAAPPDGERSAQQKYLEGVIYYQKGDYVKARAAWTEAKRLAPKGSETEKDASAGLERIAKVFGDAPAVGGEAKSLKEAPERKDEHEAMQTYLLGLLHYQKGDLARARTEWTRAKALAPEGSSTMSDAKGALEKLDKEEASTGGDRKK